MIRAPRVRFVGWAFLQVVLSAILGALTPVSVAGQEPVTVSGRVTSGNAPVPGATILIVETGSRAESQPDGSFRFIIPSAMVRGQSVTITARHRRYGSQSASIALVGGSVVQDFVLVQQVETPASAGGESRPMILPDSLWSVYLVRGTDSSALGVVSGPVDFVSSLAGRIAGLNVTSAASAGFSSPIVRRGPRSMTLGLEPLFVVDGVPLDNSGFNSAAQRFGRGGFDYGSPIQDISLGDIASVTVMDPVQAATLYGSRAANGVIQVRTKNGVGTDGLTVAADYQMSFDQALRLPEFQNQFGQGLGGSYEFFDGRGGGINDSVAQSWGPALDGRPRTQASLIEPGIGDVRLWLPHPSGVRNYFASGKTTSGSGAIAMADDRGSVRVSISGRTVAGLTTNAQLTRFGGGIAGTFHPTARLRATGSVHVAGTSSKNRHGTGFDEVNPIAGFLTTGRQVDLDTLRAVRRDSSGRQLNWIYTARNNPFIQLMENVNDDKSAHVFGGAGLSYVFHSWLTASVRAAADNYNATRNFKVASGWKSGYPTELGRQDFSGGGAQLQTLSSTQTFGQASLTASPKGDSRIRTSLTVGLDLLANSSSLETVIGDRPVALGSGGGIASAEEKSSNDVSAVFLSTTVAVGTALTLSGGVRRESASALPSSHRSNLYPSLQAAFDLKNGLSIVRNAGLRAATVRASWWRAGNELNPGMLARGYGGGGTSLTPTLGIAADSGTRSERTSGIEIGATIAVSTRVGLDVAFYKERSTDLLVATATGEGDAPGAYTGEISNSGVEAQLRVVPIRLSNGATLELALTFAKNRNRVEALAGGLDEVSLGPPAWTASVVARTGHPLGSLVGRRLLRDETGALVLKGGLPIADASGGFAVLGSWQPSATGGVSASFRFAGAEAAALLDARFGGRVFSATNYWGSYAGTLQSTADRPEVGIVIAGIDSAKGTANGTAVSTEAYYHALGAVAEPWVYDASFAKLRELRLTYALQLHQLPRFEDQSIRVSVVTRNLWMWSKVPNIDPETALAAGAFQGLEMGQLPSTRSIGVRFSITP
jgi:hypothetical protein